MVMKKAPPGEGAFLKNCKSGIYNHHHFRLSLSDGTLVFTYFAGAAAGAAGAAGATSFLAAGFFAAGFFVVFFFVTFFLAGASVFASAFTSVPAAGFTSAALSAAKETPPNNPVIARDTTIPAIKFFFICYQRFAFINITSSKSFSFLSIYTRRNRNSFKIFF
jgi:hypothetical protein